MFSERNSVVGETTSGTWTGEAELTEAGCQIVVYVYAGLGGTLYIEQSPDGTNWDLSESVSTSSGVYTKQVKYKWFRIRFTMSFLDTLTVQTFVR